MKRLLLSALLVSLLGLGIAPAQSALPAPVAVQQFFDANGKPLAGGKLFSYLAGGSTLTPTFQNSSMSAANTNPAILDSAGRLNIWLDPSKSYKFVLQTSGGVPVWTADNIPGLQGLGVFMPLAGGTITGAVSITGGISISGGFSCSGTGCPSSGGGGTGTPAGSDTQVQFNNAGAFGASPNFTWNNSGRLLNISTAIGQAGLNVQNGFIQSAQGYVADPGIATTYNAINAIGGGIAVKSVTATNYVHTGNSNGVPPLTAGEAAFHPGAMYFDTGTNSEKVFNGSAWLDLGGGSGSPGGINTNVQFNCGGSFCGAAEFWYDSVNRLLNVDGVATTAAINAEHGFVQSAEGFVAPLAATYNVLNAPNGGAAVRSVTATGYIQPGNGVADPSTYGGDSFHAGALYYNTTNDCLMVRNNAATFNCVGGGGSGSPGGSNTQIQFNNSGSFGASPNFTWTNASQLLNVVGVAFTAGINVQNGFIQADQGFVGPPGISTTYNVFNAVDGGAAVKSVTATAYIQPGNGAGDPIIGGGYGDSFHPGAMYYNTTNDCLKVRNNGGTFSCVGGGGGGTPGGSNQDVQFNNVGAFGGSGGTFTWNNSSRLLNVNTFASQAGINVQNGFIQSDQGFVSAGPTYNTVNVTNGGVATKSVTASLYLQPGFGPGDPGAYGGDSFHMGAMYYNTTSDCLKIRNNAGVFNCVGTGGAAGVASLNTLTGALTIAGTTNRVSVSAAGSTIILSAPQDLGISSSVQFGNVTTTGGGVFQSSAAGSTIAFQTTNFNFQVDGNGNISAAGQLNLTGGSSAIKVGGITVIDVNRIASFQSMTAVSSISAPTVTATSVLNLTGASQVRSPSGTVGFSGSIACGSGFTTNITVSGGLITALSCT